MITDSVFISYSDNDVDYANEIANTLKSKGINIWIDTINGKDDDAIQEAIKSSKIFLIITSNNALEDLSLKQEKDFARDNKIERLLVIIEPCKIKNKFRWDTLPSVNLTVNKHEGIERLLGKCGIQNTAIEPMSPTLEKSNDSQDEVIEIESKPIESNQELSRKESLLVSDEDIDNVHSIVKNRLRGARNQTYIYIAGAVGLIILVLTNGTFKEMFATGKEEVDGALGFLEKFYPGITAALPTVISGGAFKKLKEHKQNIALVDQIKSKRDRMSKAIATFSEPEIIKLEEDLGKLIEF